MAKKQPIRNRIATAIRLHGSCGMIVYHELAVLVFPNDDYPNARNSPTRGGPPGCYMVLSRAIREHGFSMYLGGDAVVYATVGLGKNKYDG